MGHREGREGAVHGEPQSYGSLRSGEWQGLQELIPGSLWALFSPTATDSLLHTRDLRGERRKSQIPADPTSENLLLGSPSLSPSSPPVFGTQ